MLILLVVSYTLHFLGQLVVFGSIARFEINCGNIPLNSEVVQNMLIPQKSFAYLV